MAKKTEQTTTITVPELLELLQRNEERLAYFEGMHRAARRAYAETQNPHRVTQALGLTTGSRGSDRRKDTILPLYRALSEHPKCGPVRAIQVLAKAFRYSSEFALAKRLRGWRQYRGEYVVPGDGTLNKAQGHLPRANGDRPRR